jgi:hypothetical protein
MTDTPQGHAMNTSHTDPHEASQPLARSELGHVSTCACGVVTVTLHYLSLRFEPAAFRELLGMLALAQHRIDSDPSLLSPRTPSSIDAPPVH